MIDIARQFITENKELIVCEPSGQLLANLEKERVLPVYMKLID